jgi:hypothetical protein
MRMLFLKLAKFGHVDHVVTGSDNREIYETAARDHVRSAMEGYNAVVFAVHFFSTVSPPLRRSADVVCFHPFLSMGKLRKNRFTSPRAKITS